MGRPPAGPSWRRAGPALGRKGCVRAPPLASAPAVSRSFRIKHPLPCLRLLRRCQRFGRVKNKQTNKPRSALPALSRAPCPGTGPGCSQGTRSPLPAAEPPNYTHFAPGRNLEVTFFCLSKTIIKRSWCLLANTNVKVPNIPVTVTLFYFIFFWKSPSFFSYFCRSEALLLKND